MTLVAFVPVVRKSSATADRGTTFLASQKSTYLLNDGAVGDVALSLLQHQKHFSFLDRWPSRVRELVNDRLFGILECRL